MFCSTIIPTIGRESVHRAVQSVLSQKTEADFEVIVVNDSGLPLAEADWQRSESVRILATNRRERSVARNTGAAIARGKYLHFLDDDDWLVPGALDHLWRLAKTSQAGWLYGTTQLVDRHRRPLIQLEHGLFGNSFVQTMAGEWVPLQSSLIAASTFFAIGGFEPLISGPEDIDLLRRVALHGDLAGTPAVVSCLGIGEEGSSTDFNNHARRSRWAREKILAQPGVYARLCDSVDGPEWSGRMVRIYLTSSVWNLQNGSVFIAVGRLATGLTALFRGIAWWGRGALWRGLARPYQSHAFRSGKLGRVIYESQ